MLTFPFIAKPLARSITPNVQPHHPVIRVQTINIFHNYILYFWDQNNDTNKSNTSHLYCELANNEYQANS